MEDNENLDHRDYIHRKAKRGFGKKKKELLEELKSLQWQIDHTIIRHIILRDYEEELNALRVQYKEKLQELHSACSEKSSRKLSNYEEE